MRKSSILQEETGRVPNKKTVSQNQGLFNAAKIAVELMLPVGYAVLKIAVKGL